MRAFIYSQSVRAAPKESVLAYDRRLRGHDQQQRRPMCRGAPKHAPLILCHSLPCCHPLECRNFRQEPPAQIAILLWCGAQRIVAEQRKQQQQTDETRVSKPGQSRARPSLASNMQL